MPKVESTYANFSESRIIYSQYPWILAQNLKPELFDHEFSIKFGTVTTTQLQHLVLFLTTLPNSDGKNLFCRCDEG